MIAWLRSLLNPSRLIAAAIIGALAAGFLLYVEFNTSQVDAATFWHSACGIELPEYREKGRLQPTRFQSRSGNWYTYTVISQHDNYYYKARAEEVEARAAAAFALLPQPMTKTRDTFCKSYGICEISLKKKNYRRQNCLAYFNAAQGNPAVFYQALVDSGTVW